MRYTSSEAHTMRGVLLKIVCIDPLAQSFSLGVYSSHIWDMAMNTTEHNVLITTALLASLRLWFSLNMSVMRNVLANNTLPKVISTPNARTRISTSMFASKVASTLKASRPPFPKNR